jgi:hypothetical protein
MKKSTLYLSVFIALSFLMQGCVKDTLHSTYTYYLPIYKSKAIVWESIKSTLPQPLQKTGKIFLYGHYIFINEINKGVHIIDNINPQSPKNISFIAIPGNIDIAVKNTTLYADLYTDMLTIDIADPENISLKKVSNNIFPERDYINGFTPGSTKYIIDWERHETTDKRELKTNRYLSQSESWVFSSQNRNDVFKANISGNAAGVGGSMARFTIVNNYLYTVGQSTLTAFNISSPSNPVNEHSQSMGWNIETIYPLKDKLFIGAQTGMSIYSIADPAAPLYLSGFSHACFRDPVIADEAYAYVTLRAATDPTPCRGTIAAQRNELDIVNISDILNPTLVKIYDMTEPKGLSKDGNHLFICDGKAGLKIFDVKNVMDIKEVKVINNINPFDVICQDGLAIVIADEGIYQYDYSNINNIKFISKIAVTNP